MAVVVGCLFVLALGSVGAGAATPSDWNGTHHVPPEAAGEPTDQSELSTRLLASLEGRLANSSESLASGDFAAAREALGDDFDRDLDRYRELAERADDEDRAEIAASIDLTRSEQRRLAATGRDLQNATQEYRQARERGNETAAREALRRAERLNRSLATQSERVQSGYEALNRSGVDTGGASDRVAALTRDATGRVGDELDRSFEPTELTVLDADSAAGPTDPLSMRVRLTGPDGALSPDDGTVTIDGRPVTSAAWNGSVVSIEHRPLWLTAGDHDREVAFQPAPERPYAASVATVGITIRSREPAILVGDVPTVGYRDRVSVTATVQIDGEPVADAPVRAFVADEPIATGETAANGTVALSGRLPPAIEPGDRQLRVAMTATDRAVAATEVVEELSVERTPTRLTASVEDGRLTGRLTTADGRPLPDREVVIGGVDRTVTTDAQGAFDVSVAGRSGSVTVAYRAATGALGPTETRVSLPDAGGALPATPRWLPIGLLAILAVGALGAVWRRSGGSPGPTPSGTSADGADAGVVDAASLAWLYRAARESVPGSHPALTPRETASQARAELSGRRAAVVAAIARAYERQAYALDRVDDRAIEAHRAALRWLRDR
ncbi:hypothetical protein HARCEL1_13130 [Halococcoides cellulosivorans]|uniref:DUF4129 domain-containing protein n=1 Tax=Halococcoides cellulosivorans TaxID=1679096 RepID=A0A2R4X429_9EURY|nr:hypothetical protein HARCEL1_13130 [Halococcoides cellulosivorans]